MFPGFDISVWDGHLVWMWQWSNLRYIGFYLAHSAGQTQTSWTRRWHDLKDIGWGILPIWLPFADKNLDSMATANGAIHGSWAIDRARAANLERGVTIYLDVEAPIVGRGNQAGFTAYVTNWMQAVVDAGYAPGIYCSRLDANRFLVGEEFRALKPAVWPFAVAGRTRATWDDANHQLDPVLPSAWLVTDGLPDDGAWPENANTIGCQFDWFNANRDKKIFHWPEASGRSDPNAFRDSDWDMAKVFDPAHHRAATCYACASDHDNADSVSILSVHLTDLDFFTRNVNGKFTIGQTLRLTAADIGPTPAPELDGFDSVSAAGISRRNGLVDFFLVGQDGFLRTLWINGDSFPKHSWPLNPNTVARRGSPLAAVSRRLDQIDIFYVTRDHRLATQWWNPGNMDWSRNLLSFNAPLVAGGSNLAVLPSPNDGSRVDALDVFYISLNFAQPYVDPTEKQTWNDAWQVTHASWSTLTNWQFELIPNLTRIAAASGLTAVRDATGFIHVVGQNRARNALSHARLPPKGTNWDVGRGPGPIPLDSGRPCWWMSLHFIAFSDTLLLFGMLSSGALGWTTFTQNTWSDVQIGEAHFATSRPLAFARRGNSAVDIVGITETGGLAGCSLTLAKDGGANVAAANGLPY